MSTRDLIENFITTYEANFGEWPARNKPEQQRLWEPVIIGIGEALDSVVKRILYLRGETKQKPVLRQWEDELRKLNQERNPSSQPYCEWCYGQGQISCIARKHGIGQGRWEWRFNDTSRKCFEVAFPCRCANGDPFAERDEIDEDLRQRAWDSFAEILNLSGYQCEVGGVEKQITLQDFLSSQVGKELGPSPAIMRHNLLLESYRNEALFQGVPYRGPEPHDSRKSLPGYLDQVRNRFATNRKLAEEKAKSGLNPLPEVIIPGGTV